MASSVLETTICWLTFSRVPASHNHEALAGQLVAMLGGGAMRVVRTEVSEIEVVTLLLNPHTTVPTGWDLYFGDRKYRITINVSETENEMQEALMRMVLENPGKWA